MRPLGSVVVKGKSVPVEIFEVLVEYDPGEPVDLARTGAARTAGPIGPFARCMQR